MDHGTKHAVQLVRSDLLRCITAHMRQMFIYGWRASQGLIERIYWHKIDLWVRFLIPPVWGQSTSYSISYTCFIEGWTEHTVQLGGWLSWIVQNDQLGHPPSWIDHATSSADRRAGSTTWPARPSAELDLSGSAEGRAGSNTRPVQRMAELGLLCCLHPILAAPPPPSGLERTCSCFISIGVIVGTLPFKNRKNSFFRITFGLIV